ncbi:hypothetical protein Tco_1082840 [Tanacetum coccineum]|uniref:Uncharacterized protein n=1 Tax=Tanacetum coccineum TaxID=301880 RepID=A0ABQ5I1S7_9ASTR
MGSLLLNRVNISTTNVDCKPQVNRKRTFQVVIDVIKNSTCIKAFTISADVPEILMQLFCLGGFRLHAIYKCLFGKTGSNAKLRKSRIDILWGMFYRENIDYPSLIWEDIAYQIDHRREKNSRRENMPYPRFTKVTIDYFLSKLKSLKKLKFQHFHIIKDDSVKSRGKGSQGKKTADTTEESVDVFDESDPEPLIRRKTSRRKVVKKKATILVDDNIIPEPDIALELGKSIIPEPARTIRQSSITFRDTSSVSKKRTSDEGTGEIPGVLDESIFIDAEDDNEETESDYEDIYKYMINVRKNADIEMKDVKKTVDITKETTEQPLTSSSFSVPSDYGNQFLNLSHDEESNKQPPVLQQTTPTPTTIPTPPINTEAPAITTTIPEITPFIALQLRVAKLEQDMSEVKKIDHSAAVLASIQSQVPPVVDKYVGTKLDDALLKALERHTTDLVEKYSVLPALESSKKQESEKSPEEIIRIKREQEEKKQEPTYTIKSTDKAALEEFDLKSALFKSMHKNKSANRNPANYRLYHALMEALIEDENAMDKEVADTVKDHKRKHDGDDDDDDDDDEGPPAGSNQGKSTKKRRKRESESAKKPSTTKESSKGKDLKVGSKTGKSAPAKDPVEEPTDKVIIDEHLTKDIPISDEGHVSDPEDTDNAHMPKVPDTTTWFRPIPKEERPASSKPEWVIPLIDLPEAKNKLEHNSFAKCNQLRIGKEETIKGFESPAFMMVKFHENKLSLQFTDEKNEDSKLREMILRRADYNEYKISGKDFKSLHPNDLKLDHLNIQGKLDHYQNSDKVICTTRKWAEDNKRRIEGQYRGGLRRLSSGEFFFRSLEALSGWTIWILTTERYSRIE